MALKPITVRMDPVIYEVIASRATRRGVSISQYMTAAALFRAGVDYAREKEEGPEFMDAIVELADEFLRSAPLRPYNENGPGKKPGPGKVNKCLTGLPIAQDAVNALTKIVN